MADEIEQETVVPAAPRSWRGFLAATAVLLCVGLAIFWPFVFGDGVLLYRDIGSDSLTSYYVDFVHLSKYIRTEGFPSWSFHIGMGQDLAYATGFLLLEPVTWLPFRFIAQALVFQHLFKVLVTGLVFFRFLQLQRAPAPLAFLGSLVVAFSAYMTLGSCCYLFQDEVVVFAVLLLGAELALRRGRWLLLVFSVALVGLVNPFHLYLCALFLVCYVPLRLFVRSGWEPGLILKRSLALAALSALGVAFAAMITLPYLKVVLDSPRGAGATNSVSVLASLPVFSLESGAHYVTVLLRSFCNEFVGTGDAFRGWQTYIEAPQNYCGLICLLLLPQALLGGTRRHRVVVVLFLCGLVIPTAFPWFRYLFWLFKGPYYRTYSLFCVLGIVTLSLFAFRHYLERKSFSVWLLLAWAVVLAGVLFLPFAPLQNLIDPALRIAVIVCLFLYVTILLVGWLTNWRTLAGYLVVVVTAAELIYFNRISVAERNFMKKSELVDGIAAHADSIEAVADLKRDDNSFFRMTSLFGGEGGVRADLNEAMVLSYYSTSSYSSFNDSNYIRFLAAVEAMPTNQEIDARWAVGLVGNFLLSMFAGEKYALVEDPQPFQNVSQYELVRSYGSRSLFRNTLSLPLGLSYTRYLPESEFLQLPADGKEKVLLDVAVLDPASLGVAEGLTRVSASDLEKEFAASSIPAIVQQRRSSALYPRSFAQSRLVGDVRLDHDGILILQTPFNQGWHAFQDDRPVPVVRVDAGLLGLPVKAGEHKIELHYRNPWLWIGTVTTAVAAILLLLARWRWPRLPFPTRVIPAE
jgi:uncharacterized membrane protein YfhO